MPSPAGPSSAAIDATPLLGVRTGVGESVAGFIAAVVRRSRHRRCRVRPQRKPQEGPCRKSARRPSGPDGRSRFPPPRCSGRGPDSTIRRSSCWTGPVDVVHGTNFVVPPSRAGGPARDRARPDPRALPRALQPDVAALPRA